MQLRIDRSGILLAAIWMFCVPCAVTAQQLPSAASPAEDADQPHQPLQMNPKGRSARLETTVPRSRNWATVVSR